MSQETRKTSRFSNLWLKEDYWAVWIGLGTILIALLIYKLGGSIGPLGVGFEAFDNFSVVPGQLAGLIPHLILYMWSWQLFLPLPLRSWGILSLSF